LLTSGSYPDPTSNRIKDAPIPHLWDENNAIIAMIQIVGITS
jgi:hypothetical protein